MDGESLGTGLWNRFTRVRSPLSTPELCKTEDVTCRISCGTNNWNAKNAKNANAGKTEKKCARVSVAHITVIVRGVGIMNTRENEIGLTITTIKVV